MTDLECVHSGVLTMLPFWLERYDLLDFLCSFVFILFLAGV